MYEDHFARRLFLVARMPLVVVVVVVGCLALTVYVISVGIPAIVFRLLLGLFLLPRAAFRARAQDDTQILEAEWQALRDWIEEFCMVEEYRDFLRLAASRGKQARSAFRKAPRR